MLERQLECITSYDEATREQLRLIVVDDGSPRCPAQVGACAVPFKLYRCLVDVRWNWIFCRNLGVSEAETEWVMLTDIDHLLPPTTAQALVHGEHGSDTAYVFSRVSAPTMTPCKPHANSWFMTRSLYDRVGGYDERFSGCYGSNLDFNRRVEATAPVQCLELALVRVPRSVVPDASTTAYTRLESAARLRSIVQHRGCAAPLRLTFPWQRVA